MGVRLAHFNIRAKDAARSLAFYDKLGLKVVGCLNISPTFYLLYLGTDDEPNVTIELTINEQAPADYDRTPGSGHVALGVGDLDALLARLADSGIVPEAPPFNPGGRKELRVCFVTDPDGVRVELAEGSFPTPTDPPPERFTR